LEEQYKGKQRVVGVGERDDDQEDQIKEKERGGEREWRNHCTLGNDA